MDFFHKGSDPPPLIFGSYGTGGTHLILVTKKGKNKTFQKHPKWPYLIEPCISYMNSSRYNPSTELGLLSVWSLCWYVLPPWKWSDYYIPARYMVPFIEGNMVTYCPFKDKLC